MLTKEQISTKLAALGEEPQIGDNWLNPDWPSPDPATLRAASVMITLVDRPESLNVLLTQRRKDLKDHPGQISFPGGKREETDADDWSAAVRELDEEVGISANHVEKLGALQLYITRTGFKVSPFVCSVPSDVEPIPQESEVEEIFEVPLEFLIAPANRKVESLMIKGKERFFYVIPYTGSDGVYRNIWGATAGMLVSLANSLS